jgi:hypothetical protein
MSATWFLLFLIWLLNASFLVQSYHIAPSCSHYRGKDLTDMVEEAMEEAFDMKESAEYAITRDPEEGDYDNSNPELWRQADYDDHQEIKSKNRKTSKFQHGSVTILINIQDVTRVWTILNQI